MAELELLGDLKLPVAEGSDARHAISRNYIPQIITFARSGNLEVVTGSHRWYAADRQWVIKGVVASVGAAPEGSAIIIDVNIGGTSIFFTQSNRPTIAEGAFVVSMPSVPDSTVLAITNYLTVDIDQVGSTTPGADLTVQVILEIA